VNLRRYRLSVNCQSAFWKSGAPCVTTFATGRSMRPEDWRGVWDEFRNWWTSTVALRAMVDNL
jgi:hypothetical protein